MKRAPLVLAASSSSAAESIGIHMVMEAEGNPVTEEAWGAVEKQFAGRLTASQFTALPKDQNRRAVLSARISPGSIELSTSAPDFTAARNRRFQPQSSSVQEDIYETNVGRLNVKGVVRSTPATMGRNVAGFARLPTPLANERGSVKKALLCRLARRRRNPAIGCQNRNRRP